MGLEINRRGQVTIFIILAVIIVVGIVAILAFMGKLGFQFKEDLTPKQFIDKCAQEAVKPSIEKVLVGGGRANPFFFKLYQDETYNYLCYQKGYYKTCINSYPQLKEIVEQEIISDSQERIVACFESLKEDSEKKGFSFSEEELDYDIELEPKQVLIKMAKRVDMSREDNSQSFDEFNTKVLSPLYDLIHVAREIVNQESQYCNFEYGGFMLFYPEYNIKKIDYDETKLYQVFDRRSGKEFQFAVRSCALPPGI